MSYALVYTAQRNYCCEAYQNPDSRGVGQSTGRPSWSGSGEAEDLQELVQWGLKTYPKVTEVLLIVNILTYLGSAY
jgi:alpha/beta superfamily hydrolase